MFLAKTSSNDPTVVEYIETTEDELKRIAIITRKTLRFHTQISKPPDVRIDDLFNSSLSIYSGRLEKHSVRVETRNRINIPFRCLEGELQQVMNNLIGNSIDAMQLGGRPLLRSTVAHDWKSSEVGVRLTIADTGSGMSPEVLKAAFEPCFTTKGFSGTGLGLWLCKEIISRHGGTLRVRSSDVENRSGTVFTLFLHDRPIWL